MKKNIVRIILAVMLLETFFIIFGFSNQNGEQSGNLSKKVTAVVMDIIPQFKRLEKENKEVISIKVEKVTRKIAHFSIYTLVGILVMAFISTYKIQEKYKIAMSFIIGFIYATSDEIHQKFVPGRSAQVTDVIIDTMGVLLGICFVMLILEIIKNRKHCKNDRNLQNNIK